MGATDNIELVRRFYAAYLSGDAATLQQTLADNIVFTQPGRSEWAGEYPGKEQALAHTARMTEHFAGTMRLEPVDICGSDEHVVALMHVMFSRGGRTFDGTDIHVMHVRDGQIAAMRVTPYDQYLWDEMVTDS